MLRSGDSLRIPPTGLLFLLLLMIPACAGEEASTDGPPASAVTIRLPETEAGAALASALAEAGETGRHVFLHTGADW